MHISVYMAERKLRDEDVARAVGVDRSTVSRWRRRRGRPDWPARRRLHNFSHGKITAEDWELPLELSEPAEPSEPAETSPQPA